MDRQPALAHPRGQLWLPQLVGDVWWELHHPPLWALLSTASPFPCLHCFSFPGPCSVQSPFKGLEVTASGLHVFNYVWTVRQIYGGNVHCGFQVMMDICNLLVLEVCCL